MVHILKIMSKKIEISKIYGISPPCALAIVLKLAPTAERKLPKVSISSGESPCDKKTEK